MPVFPAAKRRRLQQRLLEWFHRHQRPLPWRRDRHPYRIWVSEIMLQQTQVATVVGFFDRFLRAFPSITALANADEADVLKHWEGLGYYRRARHLHQAAQILAAAHGNNPPADPAVWQALPGIGRYTLGAILSQAYDLRFPILEANSERVLSRLVGLREDPKSASGRAQLWSLAEELLPQENVGDFNQAIMELGALICTPEDPRCPQCPLKSYCVAQKEGLQKEIPKRGPGPDLIAVREVAIVLRKHDRVLLVQRPSSGRWPNMWEFPHGEIEPSQTHAEAVPRLLAELTGLQAGEPTELVTIRHAVTHHRIEVVCFDADYRSGKFCSSFYQQGQWLLPAELGEYPISSPQRRIVRAIQNPHRQQLLF